ncbi:MAG: rRNA maturation RNase YbeY [Prevotella nigrescens]|jgi:metalloprotein, YbeY family|uniref:Endoribonuclease YbeY n=1 Tax=Prevotella nigrescens TaxID=28133 RepID=A0A9D5X2D3_9BACT|nr:rRNA maturation RNase YbeY [Prevotella nigrescens]MBF1445346.1 rRNA maturation RNase YbeY [Prevotella nigrescens]MBF1448062.1 rRNA maturation RNase YbeY [Prevotella nigrescens]MBF1453685.1 rRNA maturation RNase YbeY [Prevotella nigrescens]OWP31111.1 rRNA maturation RNase YbeY [Prevotella nigrescens]QUB52361.1 rRNA maturation RNase YbeY [Prevotella nigrescens]
MITYNAEGVKLPKIGKRDTTRWIKAVAATHNRKVGEIGYMFVNDEKILEVNNEYLGHDYYTDVITFDYCEGNILNGDIVISLDTVRTNAEKFGKTYEDELYRVIIHGVLHLCGINDKGPGEREIMEENENKALALR